MEEYGGFKVALQRSAKPQDLPESRVTEGVSIDGYTTWCSTQLTEANLVTGSGLACRSGGEDVTWVHSHERVHADISTCCCGLYGYTPIGGLGATDTTFRTWVGA